MTFSLLSMVERVASPNSFAQYTHACQRPTTSFSALQRCRRHLFPCPLLYSGSGGHIKIPHDIPPRAYFQYSTTKRVPTPKNDFYVYGELSTGGGSNASCPFRCSTDTFSPVESCCTAAGTYWTVIEFSIWVRRGGSTGNSCDLLYVYPVQQQQ